MYGIFRAATHGRANYEEREALVSVVHCGNATPIFTIVLAIAGYSAVTTCLLANFLGQLTAKLEGELIIK
jgi:hypothetical protein